MSLSLSPETRDGFLITEKRKKLWAIQMDLFQQLWALCEKHGLRVWFDAGSLLGAVRHKGFIPWDDDIDTVMPREDYDKLLEIAPRELQSPYFLQCAYTDKNYFRGHAQLRHTESTAIITKEINYEFNQGIFIDIFPLDQVPVSEKEYMQLLKRTTRYKRRMRYYQQVPFTTHLLKKATYLLRHLNSAYVIGRHKGFEAYHRQFEDQFRVARRNAFAYTCAASFVWDHFPMDIYKETVLLDFEGTKVPAPAGYDTYLRILYGDEYMTPRQAPTLHGGMYVDTEHSYRDVLPRIRRAQSFGQCLLRCLTGKKEPQWLKDLKEL